MKLTNTTTGIVEYNNVLAKFPGISVFMTVVQEDAEPVQKTDTYTAEYSGDELEILAKMGDDERGKFPLSEADQGKVDQLKVKYFGEEYGDSGVQVPFTSDDAMGLLQVKAAFELGADDTVMVFSNDQKLPLTPESFPAFAAWFTQKRNSFYQDA